MIGLQCANGNYGISALSERFSQYEFKFSCFVATARKPGTVIALDVQIDTEFPTESRGPLERRRGMAQLDPWTGIKAIQSGIKCHGSFAPSAPRARSK